MRCSILKNWVRGSVNGGRGAQDGDRGSQDRGRGSQDGVRGSQDENEVRGSKRGKLQYLGAFSNCFVVMIKPHTKTFGTNPLD
jgi:hypothetical protein